MQVVSIDKVGDTLYGCVDDGVHYHFFVSERGCPVDCERTVAKGTFQDYHGFARFCVEQDPNTMILEEPVYAPAASLDELTYDILLDLWERVWVR